MAGALARDAALLVYPGGDHETFRPSWETDEIDFAKRTGFVKLALEHRVPIVPVVSIGGQETALFLGQGRAELGASGDVGDGYELVTSTMQETLSELAEQRTLPVLG